MQTIVISKMAAPLYQGYNINISSQVQSTPVASNCAEIAFINFGATTVVINNGLPLAPGASVSFNGNQNELDTTIYTLTFPPTGNNNCVVIRKYYTSLQPQ